MLTNEKGITLASLVATIIVILILTSTILININTGEDSDNYRKMCADIDTLKDQVLIYYNNYGDIPKGDLFTSTSGIQEAAEEEGNFYKIDLGKFSHLTLSFGTDGGDDIYIINEQSLNIYYVHGIEYNKQIVHAKI